MARVRTRKNKNGVELNSDSEDSKAYNRSRRHKSVWPVCKIGVHEQKKNGEHVSSAVDEVLLQLTIGLLELELSVYITCACLHSVNYED